MQLQRSPKGPQRNADVAPAGVRFSSGNKLRVLTRRSCALAFLLLAGLTQSAPLHAQAAQVELVAVPNRPTFASTAETVQRGVFEVEYGFEAAKGHQNI